MKYRHALFLNPYIESAMTSTMGLFPPTGLEYVATSAKGFVDKLTLLDLRYEEKLCEAANLLDFIRSEGIDIICVGIGWNRQFEEICGLLNRMPEDLPLIVGGYKATEEVKELFKICPKIDIIVRGEGEDTIREILTARPLKDILGISYREGDRVIHNGNRPLADLNSIVSSPDRSLRHNKYLMKMGSINVTSLTWDCVLSARGCPFNCKFCTFSLNPLGQRRGYAERSVKSVVDEIEGITANMILFSDDNFATNPKRAEEICDMISARKIKRRFMAQARIDIARYPRLLEKMIRAGFKALSLGVESPHDHILAELNKGFDSSTIRKCFKVLRRYPMFYHGFFIYGNIGETEEEMLYIPRFAKEIGLDSIAYSKLRIDKFSPLKKIAEQTPGCHVTDRGEFYSDTYPHAALKKIGRRIKFSFYTPLRILKMAWKVLAIRLFTFGEIASFVVVAPLLFTRLVIREIQKGRLVDSLRHIVVRK